MKRSFDTYTEDIYAIFKEIDHTSYHDIIRFYEGYESQVQHLDLDEHLEVCLAYVSALFEVGRYRNFIEHAQTLLEEVIYHNIKLFHGDDVFQVLLFKKAASHYQLLELEEAETILWELLKINPYSQPAAYLLRKCRTQKQPAYLKFAKAICVFLFLLSALFIAIELLIIGPFFNQYAETAELVRTAIFVGGIFILIASEGGHRLIAFNQIHREIQHLKEKR